MKETFEIVEQGYENILKQLMKSYDESDLWDIVVEYKSIRGVTIRFSWRDRDKLLMEREMERENEK